MCRLVLMNAAAARLFSAPELAAWFEGLEASLGGDGNGVAALWPETARVKVRKGITLTPEAAAHTIEGFVQQGAEWLLYHARMATAGARTSRNCHPFRHGPMTLAHNGHDDNLGALGSSIGVTDSECLALLWARLSLPREELVSARGVFIGFWGRQPFVVKGTLFSDLLLATTAKSGAILFASDLPAALRRRFDQTLEVGAPLVWEGDHLDLSGVPRRLPQVVTRIQTVPGSGEPSPQSAQERVTLETLRQYFLAQEHASSGNQPEGSGSPSPSDPVA